MKRRQSGFTLVEIAIVLVVIGLLLGGVLKGQELIASARVRNMADQQAGIQAAYYGFMDRYRAVPGDMTSAAATEAIGETVTLGAATSDGELSAPGTDWSELNGVWEQLSESGFIKGSYPGAGSTPASNPPTPEDAPLNVFNAVVILARDNGYSDPDALADRPDRLLLYMGNNVPVDIARELDVKLDDGRPRSGVLRNAVTAANPQEWESGPDCVDAANEAWNIANNEQDCHPAYLF